MTSKVNSDIVMYNIEDIKIIFQCGKNKAYEIMSTNGFPAIKVGGRRLVEKTALENWIAKNQGKPIRCK